MDLQAYRDEIKLQLTGGVLDLELTDDQIDKIIQSAFREIQRYIDTSTFVTLPYKKCIDTKDMNISSVVQVYRAKPIADGNATNSSIIDPMQAMQWQMLAGTGMPYNFTSYIYNYGAYQTALQIRNTLSTDLSFYYDKLAEKLYINIFDGTVSDITIEYIPSFIDVSQIVSPFWIDKLMRLSVALSKVVVGRIRSKFTQSNALWTLDGATLVQEGTEELSAIRTDLSSNSSLMYSID